MKKATATSISVFLSILLLLAGGGASITATYFSYLADDVVRAHRLLTATCCFMFLLGLAVTVLASSDENGRLQAPASLGGLLLWTLLIPQAGFAIGSLVNFQPSLAMMVALRHFEGTEIRHAGNGVLELTGPIGERTVQSLREQLPLQAVSTLKLESEGGLIDSARSIGAILEARGIAVTVERNCESACVIIALSGGDLLVTPDARFGFHRGSAMASHDSELGTFIGNIATNDILSSLAELGVPDHLLAQAEKTAPADMYYLSGEEMIRHGLARVLSR